MQASLPAMAMDSRPDGGLRRLIVAVVVIGSLFGNAILLGAAEYSFANSNPIQIPDLGNALPYPSLLPVAGVNGVVTKVTVTLSNLTHPRPSDLDVLVVGPGPAGSPVLLMSSAGDAIAVNGVTLTFDDAANSTLPGAVGLSSGTFRPTILGPEPFFGPPAPQAPYGSALSVFNGTMVDGVWSLFVRDHAGGELGAVAGGWTLQITTDTPVITMQPGGLTRALGGTVQFCVVAAGAGPLTYQWRLNGAVIPGETAPCLMRANLQVQNFGTYSVTVANEFGAVTSAEAPLVLDVPPTPGANDLGGATQLVQGIGLVRGDNHFANKEQGEPNHAGKPGGKSVWYRWFATASGIATFSTKGSGFDTLLAVYTGNTIASLAEVAHDEDRGGFFTSEVQFNVDEGMTYAIAIDGFAGDEGDFLLHWGLEAGVARLPVISAQPAHQTVNQGMAAAFNVAASGSGLTYQWYFFDTPILGETGSTFTRANVQRNDVGTYTVRVMNSFGRVVRSDSVLLEIGAVSSIHSFDKLPDLEYTVQSTTGFVPVRAGQSTLSQVINNTDALTSGKEANHCGVSPSFTRWVGLEAKDSGDLDIDTSGSAIATILAVYYVTDITRLNEVACDKTDTTNRPCHVTFPALSGTNYVVAVDGYYGATGEICLNWKLDIRLSAARSGTNCLLSWIAHSGEYQLQSTASLKSPPGAISWSGVPNPVAFDRRTNRVTMPLPPGPTNRFFRLRKP
jgi:hypothetical protein